jgi:hypothetical protein
MINVKKQICEVILHCVYKKRVTHTASRLAATVVCIKLHDNDIHQSWMTQEFVKLSTSLTQHFGELGLTVQGSDQ